MVDTKFDGLRIAHLADVHFRGGTSRHDEYRRVFEGFFTRVQDMDLDFIYIGGDIFHTKTQNITPEVIELIAWWFKRLAEVAPIVVILGNHDGNLMNRSRQDAITPILNLLDDDRIVLYKQSGVYPSGVDGVNWCVFSCFDEQSWEHVKPVPGQLNIAFFHGSVVGAKTEQDYELGADVDVDFFDGFDFAMLGDIHRTQFLSYRDCIDGERRPWMAYCGSTVQQNYGEDPEHGFLLWDIRARDDFDVKFVRLDNPHRFVTIDWEGDVDEVLSAARNYGRGVRYRIRSRGSVPQADWRRLTHALKLDVGAREVVPKVEPIDVGGTPADVILDMTNDIRNPHTLLTMISDFHGSIPDDEAPELDALLKGYCREAIASTTVARGVRWSLDRLEFDNTFAYGEGNVVDFSSMNGITGIFGKNATGKSSIIGTIMYTLFNATDRGTIKNLHVINVRRDSCRSKAHVSIDGRRYIVDRSSKKYSTAKGDVGATTSLDFSCVDTGRSLNGEQRRDTEREIRRHIGLADDFMLTSLAVQGGLKSFIGEKASQRKAILSRFLDLQVFEWIHERAKADVVDLRARVKDMPERDWGSLRANLVAERDELEAEIASLDGEIEQLMSEASEKQVRLAGMSDEPCIAQSDIDASAAAVRSLETRYASLQVEHERLTEAAAAADHRIELVERVRESFPLKMYEERVDSIVELEGLISRLEGRLDEEMRTLQTKKKSSLKLLDVPCGDQFPTCKYIRDSHRDRADLPHIEALVEELRDELAGKQMHLTSLAEDGSRRMLERYHSVVGRTERYELQAARAEQELHTCTRNLEDVYTRLDSERCTLEEMKAAADGADASLEQRRIKDELNDIKDSIRRMDTQRISTAQRVGRIDAELDKLDDEEVEYRELSRRWRAYERIIDATSKKGVPSQVLRHLVPAINDEVAKILGGIVDFTVELELPDDSNAMDVYINYGDSRRIIELGSGMEKMVASIAIRVALINVSSLPKTDMLVIDEGFSELDDINIDACGNLLRALTRWFRNVVIITHIWTLKDVVDNIVDITADGTDARVRHE